MTAPPRASSPSAGRVPTLDGLRGVAILLVMLFHFWGLLPGLVGRTSTRTLDVLLTRVFRTGWSGVDLFFVLSGFLITGILWDARGSRGAFGTFFARRVLRIFPPYYAFLALVLFVAPASAWLARVLQVDALRAIQVWCWTYALNVGTALSATAVDVPLTYTHLWSLCVEEQFYLVWPFVVLWAPDRRRLMWLCALLVPAALAFRWVSTLDALASVFARSAPYALMAARMDALAIGGYVALAARGAPGELDRLVRWAPRVGAVAAAVLAVLFVRTEHFWPVAPGVRTIGLSAVALVAGALLVRGLVARPGGLLHRVLVARPLRTLGTYAYVLYLVHLVVGVVLVAAIGDQAWTRDVAGSYVVANVLFSVLALTVSVAVAWCSWHGFERRVLALKRWFPRRDEPGVES